MSRTVSIFMPSGKAVMAIIMVNLIALASVGTSIIYLHDLAGKSLYDTALNPNDQFISSDGSLYWIGVNSYYPTQTQVAQLISNQYQYTLNQYNGQYHKVPLLLATVTQPAGYSVENYTTFSMRLLFVQDGYAFIRMDETTSYVPKISYTGSFDAIRSNDQYLLVVTPAGQTHAFNITNPVWQLDTIKPYGTQYVIHLRPWILFGSQVDPSLNSTYAISSHLVSSLLDNLTTSNLMLTTATVHAGAQLPISASSLDLPTALAGTTFYQIPYLRHVQLQLVDTSGILHFTGSVDNVTSFYAVDGNYTGTNSPEYYAVNPKTGQSAMWDIVPMQDYSSSDNLQLTPLPDGKVLISFIGKQASGFYDNQQYNYDSALFNDTALYARPVMLQFTIIDPLHPTTANMIQFNKAISQTSQATVIFPRPTNYTEYPINGYPTYQTLVHGNQVYVAAAMYHTDAGPAASLSSNGFTSGTSDGRSLISLRFNINGTYEGYSTIDGPEKVFSANNTNLSEPFTVNGMNVQQVYYFGISPADSSKFIVAYNAFYVQGSGLYYKYWPTIISTANLEVLQ